MRNSVPAMTWLCLRAAQEAIFVRFGSNASWIAPNIRSRENWGRGKQKPFIPLGQAATRWTVVVSGPVCGLGSEYADIDFCLVEVSLTKAATQYHARASYLGAYAKSEKRQVKFGESYTGRAHTRNTPVFFAPHSDVVKD